MSSKKKISTLLYYVTSYLLAHSTNIPAVQDVHIRPASLLLCSPTPFSLGLHQQTNGFRAPGEQQAVCGRGKQRQQQICPSTFIKSLHLNCKCAKTGGYILQYDTVVVEIFQQACTVYVKCYGE